MHNNPYQRVNQGLEGLQEWNYYVGSGGEAFQHPDSDCPCNQPEAYCVAQLILRWVQPQQTWREGESQIASAGTVNWHLSSYRARIQRRGKRRLSSAMLACQTPIRLIALLNHRL